MKGGLICSIFRVDPKVSFAPSANPLQLLFSDMTVLTRFLSTRSRVTQAAPTNIVFELAEKSMRCGDTISYNPKQGGKSSHLPLLIRYLPLWNTSSPQPPSDGGVLHVKFVPKRDAITPRFEARNSSML